MLEGDAELERHGGHHNRRGLFHANPELEARSLADCFDVDGRSSGGFCDRHHAPNGRPYASQRDGLDSNQLLQEAGRGLVPRLFIGL